MSPFLAVIVLLLHQSLTTAANKLKLSILMFRHGDRSPISDIPTDIYTTTNSWPQGPGQLSTIGSENHLRNGKFFRARYTDPTSETFLGLDPYYKRIEVYVRSTDKERTLMSAESFLAGLFPPPENNLTSPLNIWQPIPVHTVPHADEKMLDGAPVPCKAFEESYHETVLKNSDFLSFMRNNTENTKKVIDICGWKRDHDLLSQLSSMETTYDTLFCEISHNYTLKKEFVEADIFNLVVPYNTVRWGLFTTMTDAEKAFTGGVLLRELKTRVRAAIEQKDKHKLIIYSGHDTTLAAILTCLGVYDGVQTPYATVLAVEVWETEDGGHVIQLIRHHKDEDLITYTLPGCDESGCTEQQFYSLNANLEMSEDDIMKKCNKKWPDMVPSINKNVLFILLCLTILITLCSIIVMTIYLFSLKKKNFYSSLSAQDQKQSLLDDDELRA